MDNYSELLTKYGIDYAKGLKNCMDDIGFYKKILSMFMEDDCILRAKSAFGEKHFNELFNCMHELKGVAGNAGLTGLFSAVVPAVEYLRGNAESADFSTVADLFEKVLTAYDRTVVGIEIILSE